LPAALRIRVTSVRLRVWQTEAVDTSLKIVPRAPEDVEWIRETFVREWHGDDVGMADGSTVQADDVPALVAWVGEGRVGLVAYVLAGSACEIVALVAQPTGQGVGSTLVEALAELARADGCSRLEVATTNDNLDALRFYQRRGFTLTELHPKMMDGVRQRKPEVPLIGQFGIPLRDVVVLTRELG
jgi:GNAT superfamily N-acetyltransferase